VPLQAERLVPKQRARFAVAIPSDGGRRLEARFRSVSGLAGRIIVGTVRHAGSVIPYKYPQGVEFPEAVLECGATTDRGLFNWFADVVSIAAGIGGKTRGHRRDVIVMEHSREFGRGSRVPTIVGGYILAGAFPVDFSPGEYDNESDEFLIESVTLTYDYLRPTRQLNPSSVRDISHLTSRFP